MAHHPRRSRSAHGAVSVGAAAFAEGRRLRRAAERRRHHRHPAWHAHSRGPRRAVLGLLLLPVVLAGLFAFAVAIIVTGAFVLAVVSAAVPTILIGGGVFVAVRRRRRRLARAAGTAPLPGRPAAPKRPDMVWSHARDRFHTLAAAYAAHECDPMNVLRLPALSDVTVPSTGRFVEAFAQAQALESDAFPGEAHAASFVGAVDLAERSWRAAREAAERIRLSGLSPAERSTVERVLKLLTVARDSGSEPERLAAYSRARAELAKLDAAGVVHLPVAAAAALDAAARGALPA